MARYTPAIYTHCYDGSGTRLFAAGGPLAVERRGNYASIWSWFRNKCQNRAVEISLQKKKSSHTTHARQSIYYYLSFCLVNSILLIFFFHPILLKNLGDNFSTITENVVILTLTYELSNCWFGENKAANKVMYVAFYHLFNASDSHRFSLSPSSPQFSTAQSLLRCCGLAVRNFLRTWKKKDASHFLCNSE
jgi:hypothetical protein